MKNVQLTPQEYADKRKLTLSAITKAIREKREMPGVKKIEKFGRFYLLTVCEKEITNESVQ